MHQHAEVITVHAERGESATAFLNPLGLFRALRQHRELLSQITRREIVGRYRGSYLGVFWALLTPLLTLAVFTLVFGAMQHNRWAGEDRGILGYPMNLFIGIILFSIFSDVASRAPILITSNPNYVKKAVFPLELLAISVVLAALVQALLMLLIELAVVWIVLGHIPASAILLPLVLLPAALLSLAVCWAMSAIGVFFRDLPNIVPPLVQLLFFLTPIVYPTQILDGYSTLGSLLRYANPFITIVDSARCLLLGGPSPHWLALGVITLASLLLAMAGYILFMKTRRYFADAL